MQRKECATCPFYEKRKGGYCGYAVVEGRGKCRLTDEVVGFGAGWVSPLRYEDGEKREVFW